jgi:hypothetical protein
MNITIPTAKFTSPQNRTIIPDHKEKPSTQKTKDKLKKKSKIKKS